MKSNGNKLQDIYKKIDKEIKSRGGSITKDQFFNDIAETISEGNIEKLVIKYSPFSYLSNKKMEEDPNFLEKVKALYESESGASV